MERLAPKEEGCRTADARADTDKENDNGFIDVGDK